MASTVGPGWAGPFANADAVFVLAFSTIMLQTDLHNVGIPAEKKMKLDQFISNNRGINDGASLPREFLEELYASIAARPIQMDVGIEVRTQPSLNRDLEPFIHSFIRANGPSWAGGRAEDRSFDDFILAIRCRGGSLGDSAIALRADGHRAFF